MTEAQLFALGLTLAALSGIRAYLTVFGIGLAGYLGWIDLPPALEVTTSPWVLGTAGALTIVEFFADKIPGVDSGWDLLHTLLRIPVGAFLAAATLSPDGHLSASALAVGAGMTLAMHAMKAGTRAVINASPEPLSNWTLSLGEDGLSLAGLGIAFSHPWLALTMVVGVAAVVAFFAYWIARRLIGGVRRVLGGSRAVP